MTTGTTIDDRIAPILELSGIGRHAEAETRVAALLASCATNERPIVAACAAIVDWRARVARGAALDEGFAEAVAGFSRLEEDGHEVNAGWVASQIGFTIGILGDLETGLEWTDRGIEDARRRNDRRLLINAYANKASLYIFAEDHDRGLILLQQALDECGDDGQTAVIKCGLMNNLAYCQLLRARRCRTDDPKRTELARLALGHADELLSERESPVYQKWSSHVLDTRGVALGLLGRLPEAAAAFAEGLRQPDVKRRTRASLLTNYAEVLIAAGRHEPAAELLTQAEAEAVEDLVDGSHDRILGLRIEVARHFNRHDEVEALWARRFRRLADHHSERLRNVKRYSDLFDQLKQARAAERQTRQEIENEKARREEQERLLAMLAHEVKTPLATIRIGTDEVESIPPEVRRAIGDIDGIIQRCVQAGRLEAGRLAPRWEDCDVGALVLDLPAPPGHDEQVQVAAPAGCRIRTDSQLLQYVVRNLVDNAIKYGPPEGRAELRVTPEGPEGADGVRIEVANLPGVAGWPDAERVFTKYYRAPQAHRSIGSGLGLFLVQGLVQHLGGSVDYAPTSTHVRFVVRLPRGDTATAA